ncbi:Transcriptional activator protein CzcR [Pseudomonas veronii 1YdBTEX2]|uniref:Transcriptional activator protein CzcR n=1 Tax=Pseudomonas veronii 1YdBTEX2 TaxID=1295141 RepID=A0A1D3K6J7_PSEVE|nr:response regulator transcription factor [Pseudomonas veronii]SBW83947.1 Transcriptional activator protein CzcR [Pseudomonas veronii 1YdBTEX2]
MRILVIEDDARTASYLVRGLGESGHVVDASAEGRDGLAMALEGIYDALIVDRCLPGMDGLSLVRELRREGMQTPVLMLSALASTQQRVEGLQAGCDDYLAKPYAFVEVLARLEGLLRPRDQHPGKASTLCIGELCLDSAARQVTWMGRTISLAHRETLILEKLMKHCGEVVTRLMLLESAWDYEFDPNDNVIDKHIYRLRRKLDDGFGISLIATIPGAGYCLNVSTNLSEAPAR